MKKTAGSKSLFAAPRSAAAALLVFCAVPFLLWYQSSRDDKGTSPGFSRYNVDQFSNTLAEQALNLRNPECDSFLLLYVEHLVKNGWRTAPLTWLRMGAERGMSAKVMGAYAEALAGRDPAAAAEWRKKASEFKAPAHAWEGR